MDELGALKEDEAALLAGNTSVSATRAPRQVASASFSGGRPYPCSPSLAP